MSKYGKIRPSINIARTIQELMVINNDHELIEFLSDLTSQLQLKNFWHMVAPNKFQSKQQILTAVNDYPKEFEEDYIRGKKQVFNCPVLHYAYKHSQKPMLWRDMIDYAALTNEQNQIMEWYSTYEINTGICFTIHEPGNAYAVLTFLLHDHKYLAENELEQIKQYLSILGNLIHQKYKEILNCFPDSFRSHLTTRESECLIWAAKGKTAWETAQILNISEYTVRDYLTNVMKKLNVATKVAAVSKAILANDINYNDINND